MGRKGKTRALALLMFLGPFLLPGGNGKISGKVYADYYYMFGNHDPHLEGMNGFWFRRIYFTYDHRFTPTTKIRVRFEANSQGDFLGSDKISPYVKDLYLEWKRGSKTLIVGISPAPTFNKIEEIWGYRSVEKTPLDLYKLGHSRGTGIALLGDFARGKIYYHLMFSNGEGNKSEYNPGKKLMAALGFSPSGNFYFEIYGDYEGNSGPTPHAYTLQGFASATRGKFTAGIQYSEKTYESGEEIKLRVASAFLKFGLSPKVILLGRVDRMMDPNPYAQKIPYLPMDPTSPFTLFLLGLDYRLSPHISLIPNIEVVNYDSGLPGDLMGKITLYYRWKGGKN